MFFVNKYILFIITIFLTQCNNNDSQNTQDKLEQAKKDQLNDILEYFNEIVRLVNETSPEKIKKKKDILDIFFYNIANLIQDSQNTKLKISKDDIHKILNVLSQCNDYFQDYENKKDSLKKNVKYIILYFEDQLKKNKEHKGDPNKPNEPNTPGDPNRPDVPNDPNKPNDEKEIELDYYDKIIQTIKTELGLVQLNKIDYNETCKDVNDFIVDKFNKNFYSDTKKLTRCIEFQEGKISNNYLPHIYGEFIMNILKRYIDYYDDVKKSNENLKNMFINSHKNKTDQTDDEVNYEIDQKNIDNRVCRTINENFYRIILDDKYLISRVEFYSKKLSLNQYPMAIMQVLSDIDDKYNNSNDEIFTIKTETDKSEKIIYNTVCYLVLSSFNKNYCVKNNLDKLYNHMRFQDVPILKALRIFNMIKTSFQKADLEYYKNFILSHNNVKDNASGNYNTDLEIKQEVDNFNKTEKTNGSLTDDSMAKRLINEIYKLMQKQITGNFTKDRDIIWCTNYYNRQNISSYVYVKYIEKIQNELVNNSDLIFKIPYNLVLNIPSYNTDLSYSLKMIFDDQHYENSILYHIISYVQNHEKITKQGLDKLLKKITDTYNTLKQKENTTIYNFFSTKTNLTDNSYEIGNEKLKKNVLINYLKQYDASSKKQNFDIILINRILSALLYIHVIINTTN